jgi:Cu/Ag efflux protein CusF
VEGWPQAGVGEFSRTQRLRRPGRCASIARKDRTNQEDAMRKIIGIGMAVVLALGVAATAICAETGAATESTKTGVVKKVDLEGKKIVVMVKRELTFAIKDTTKIVQGDTAKMLADIKEGDTVTVVYTHEGQDNRVASKVTIDTPAK